MNCMKWEVRSNQQLLHSDNNKKDIKNPLDVSPNTFIVKYHWRLHRP